MWDGGFVPCRKQGILTSSHYIHTHKSKALVLRARERRKWRVSLWQNYGLRKVGLSQPRLFDSDGRSPNRGFAEKTLIFIALNAIRKKKGVQFRNPQAIRENRAIRANLRIDSRESGHLSFSTPVEFQFLLRVVMCCVTLVLTMPHASW